MKSLSWSSPTSAVFRQNTRSEAAHGFIATPSTGSQRRGHATTAAPACILRRSCLWGCCYNCEGARFWVVYLVFEYPDEDGGFASGVYYRPFYVGLGASTRKLVHCELGSLFCFLSTGSRLPASACVRAFNLVSSEQAASTVPFSASLTKVSPIS